MQPYGGRRIGALPVASPSAALSHIMFPMRFDDERYSRQILFPGVGQEGQRKLAAARVVIVGCGATGSVLSSLLVRAGVGYVRIVDRDYIEPSNLQRQVLFDEADAAASLPKAIAAERKLKAINSSVIIDAQVEDLTPRNCAELLEETDLILDGTDNFETRYLINDYAVRERRPWIYTAAVASYGVTMNILPGETACLACVFPAPPTGAFETCETGGILNSAVNLIASAAVTEAMKFLVGAHDKLRRTLLSFDAWYNDRSEVRASQPRADCTVCGQRQFAYLAGRAHAHISLCGRNSVQIHERHRPVDFAELSERLAPHGEVRHTEYVLRFLRAPYEMTVFPDGRAIIKGTTDVGVARSLYARFLGT
jgi:adenylyltransferase/sulfurtransferase